MKSGAITGVVMKGRRFCAGARAALSSPPYPGIGLGHGEAPREDWFPVVWRADGGS